jgi:peroxiredoxin
MKKHHYIFLFLLTFGFCTAQTFSDVSKTNPSEIQKSYSSWRSYQQEHIMLSTDFVALDNDGTPITTDVFLQKLSGGTNIPVVVSSKNAALTYQLYAINPTSDTSIKATIAEIAINEIDNRKKLGQPFPAFSFPDLSGTLITNETLQGKIVVIKCWYLHCAACLKEFPEVNALAAQYQDRSDIYFLSLAEDSPEQLKVFLAKKPLSYAVVPNLKTYMNLTLQLNAFPTHFILNKKGEIVSVVSDAKALAVALQKVASQKE